MAGDVHMHVCRNKSCFQLQLFLRGKRETVTTGQMDRQIPDTAVNHIKMFKQTWKSNCSTETVMGPQSSSPSISRIVAH